MFKTKDFLDLKTIKKRGHDDEVHNLTQHREESVLQSELSVEGVEETKDGGERPMQYGFDGMVTSDVQNNVPENFPEQERLRKRACVENVPLQFSFGSDGNHRNL